ncbi:putative membrane protein YedE/YeeE [Paraburkholderia sp. BL10I2N1]|nr:putative membrane protein YedE/YeeE [Paraburkholderia sp. BL10I2N1]
MSDYASPVPRSPVPRRFSIDPKPLGISAALIVLGALYLAQTVSARQAALYVVGALLGVALYHAAFGFTSARRVLIADGRGAGLRAQMVMLAIGVALFFPALSAGSLFGMPVAGFVSPAGTSVVVGAFIFGIGMQLGGGCASGTLYTVGGDSTRMIVTLVAFIVGSVVATAHMPFWRALPSLKPVSLVKTLGAGPALAVNWIVFAAIAALTVVIEKRRHGRLVGSDTRPAHASPWLHGPWPMMAGAVALALLNFATLALSGRPWGITSAFALWGAKAASAIGFDVASWPYWAGKANAAALAAPVSRDVTSVWISALCWAQCLPRRWPAATRRYGACRCVHSLRLASAVCCLAMARGSLMAAISARISAALRRAVCTAGCGLSRRSSATCSARSCVRCSGWKWSGSSQPRASVLRGRRATTLIISVRRGWRPPTRSRTPHNRHSAD